MAAKKAYVALLRGINVGGKNRLPMADLAAMFTEAGCGRVKTYIQSGNVVFEATEATLPKVAKHVEAEVQKRFGFRCVFVTRSREEIEAVLKKNPYLGERAGEVIEEKWLHVYFLAEAPGKAAVAGLDPERSPGDRFQVAGRDVYLHVPKGMGQTKLTNAFFDGKLKTMSTARNWATVKKLAEMMAEIE
jgi:uncharacterized protein (DUF1697 family)